jgi:hypothetical protein
MFWVWPRVIGEPPPPQQSGTGIDILEEDPNRDSFKSRALAEFCWSLSPAARGGRARGQDTHWSGCVARV